MLQLCEVMTEFYPKEKGVLEVERRHLDLTGTGCTSKRMSLSCPGPRENDEKPWSVNKGWFPFPKPWPICPADAKTKLIGLDLSGTEMSLEDIEGRYQ